MNKRRLLSVIVLLAMLLASCNLLSNPQVKIIRPSDVNISENRDVSGFDSIEFSTLGKVNIIQGDQESLNISGPDNVVPLIITEVRNNTLIIRTEENINITAPSSQNPLTFTIVAKDLSGLTVSGVGDVQVDAVTTPRLDVTMSGAGMVQVNQLVADELDLNLSGAGGMEITGEAQQTTIEISGVGGVNAPDLKTSTADINISGLGGVVIWVTDQLTGEISGSGNVSYYGDPQTSTSSTGIGTFKPLGSK